MPCSPLGPSPIPGRRSVHPRPRRTAGLVRLLVLLLAASCAREEAAGTAPPAKAVSVGTLRTGVPRTETLVAGVVEPFRRSDAGFDVSGLVMDVIDLGQVAEGPQYDGAGGLLMSPSGTPVQEGTVLAILDSTRFEQALTAAELALASMDRQIEALQVELDTVYPARLESARASASASTAEVASARESVAAAEAELELARTTVERDRVLIESGAVAQSVLDSSESVFRTATAGLAQARAALDAAEQSEQSASAYLAETDGSRRVRESDLESLRASRAELVNDVERARTDVASCTLRAPFQGRVTARHVERGAFAAAGTPIVELTMETAVKVIFTVSGDEEKRITPGMQLPIYAGTARDRSASASEPLTGTVFEKVSVADSGTRTFRIGLILTNPLLDGPSGEAAPELGSITDLFPVLSLPSARPEDLFVNVRSTLASEGRTFVLALPQAGADPFGPDEVLVPRRVPVRLTDDWKQLDRWTLRRVEPTADLRVGDALVLDPSASAEAGVRIGAGSHALRPGDVVRVGLRSALPESGYWVPATAVIPKTGEHLLFVVEQGVARAVRVAVAGSSGAFRRVTAAELQDGASVVLRGMQYLSDGDAVVSEPLPNGGGR